MDLLWQNGLDIGKMTPSLVGAPTWSVVCLGLIAMGGCREQDSERRLSFIPGPT